MSSKDERAAAARRARKAARIQLIADKARQEGYAEGFSKGAITTEQQMLVHAGSLFEHDLDAAARAVREVHHQIRDAREHTPITGLHGEVAGSLVEAFKNIKRA